MVSYVFGTHEIREWPIIWSNELKNTLHIKYNRKIYYNEVPEIQTVHENRSCFQKKNWKKHLQKQTFLMHFAVPISLQLKVVFKSNLFT